MTWQDGLRYAAGGVVLCALIWAMARVAVALQTSDERRANRQRNRTKLVRREPIRFDVAPLRMSTEVWCDWGGHSVDAVGNDPERIGHTICSHCVSFRARDTQSFFTQESA